MFEKFQNFLAQNLMTDTFGRPMRRTSVSLLSSFKIDFCARKIWLNFSFEIVEKELYGNVNCEL